MSRPQQPELARSAKTDLDPDHIETGLQGQKKPPVAGETGPVPVDNQPGHHPPKEQDKPDLDAFAARLGTDPKAPTATSARKGNRPAAKKAAPAKAGAAKNTPAKSTPAKSASRPAATTPKESPAAPPKVEATPGKRPAAAPMAWPESAPSADHPGPLGEPQEQPQHSGNGGHREPFYVSLALLPLRGTVKWLEQLDRNLTERLNPTRRS